jgi:hypothetical protein
VVDKSGSLSSKRPGGKIGANDELLPQSVLLGPDLLLQNLAEELIDAVG